MLYLYRKESSALTYLSHWIPAFAGMTKFNYTFKYFNKATNQVASVRYQGKAENVSLQM